MTQDCLNSPSTADVSKRLPKGIHVIGAERLSDPSVEGISRRKRIRKKEDPSTNPTSWSYIFILHMAAKGMEKWLEKFNADEKNTKQPYFIHKTLRYSYKDEEKQQGVKKTLEQSVSGLVFSHPEAKYFNVGTPGDEQLADYAARKGMAKAQLVKWLSLTPAV